MATPKNLLVGNYTWHRATGIWTRIYWVIACYQSHQLHWSQFNIYEEIFQSKLKLYLEGAMMRFSWQSSGFRYQRSTVQIRSSGKMLSWSYLVFKVAKTKRKKRRGRQCSFKKTVLWSKAKLFALISIFSIFLLNSSSN